LIYRQLLSTKPTGKYINKPNVDQKTQKQDVF